MLYKDIDYIFICQIYLVECKKNITFAVEQYKINRFMNASIHIPQQQISSFKMSICTSGASQNTNFLEYLD